MDKTLEHRFIDFVFALEALNISKYCGKSLKINEIIILKYLCENNDVKMSDLSNYLLISKSAISQLIKKLETLELVERINSKIDRKIVNIYITKKGEKTYKKILNQAIAKVSYVFEDLNEEKKNSLMEILDIIYNKSRGMEEIK